MPKIGTFGKRSRVRTDVQATPSQSIQQAGIRGRASQNLANQVGEFATQIGKQMALAERNSDTLDFAAEFGKAQNEIKLNADAKFAGTDHKGYAEWILNDEDQAANALKEKYGMSQGHIENIYKQQRIGNQSKYSNQENRKNLDFRYDNKLNNIKTMSNTVAENPASLVEHLDKLAASNSADALTFNSKRVQNLKKGPGLLTDSALNSLLSGDSNQLEMAKGILNNDDEASKRIRATLTAKEITSFKNKLTVKIDKARRMDMTKGIITGENMLQQAKFDATSNTFTKDKLLELQDFSEHLEDEAKGNTDLSALSLSMKGMADQIKLFIDEQAGIELRTDMRLSEYAAKDDLEGLDPNDPKASNKKLAHRIEMKKKYLKAYKDDPVGMGQAEKPDLIAGSNEMRDYLMSVKGIQNPPYMTKSQTEGIVDTLTNSNNPGQDLTEFYSSYPDGNGAKALAYASNEPKNSALVPFVIMNEFENEIVRKRALALNHNKVKKRFTDGGGKYDNVKAAINNAGFEGFQLGLPENDGFVNGLRNILETDVMNQVNQDVDIDKASAISFKRIIEANYEVINEGTTNFPLKRSANVHPADVRAFVKRFVSKDSIESFLDFYPDFKLEDQPGINPAEFKATEFKKSKKFPFQMEPERFPPLSAEGDFLENIHDTGALQVKESAERDGLKFMYKADTDDWKALKIRDANGNLVDLKVKWDEMNAPDLDIRKLKELDTTRGRFHQGILEEQNSGFFDNFTAPGINTLDRERFQELRQGGDTFAEGRIEKPQALKLPITPDQPIPLAQVEGLIEGGIPGRSFAGREQLISDEGVKKNAQGQHISYVDETKQPDGTVTSVITAGIGHQLSAAEKKLYPKGTVVPDKVVARWFREDSARALKDMKKFIPDSQPDVVKKVFTNMAFQLGSPRFKEFNQSTFPAIREGRYADAADHMEKSLWAKQMRKAGSKRAERQIAEIRALGNNGK